MRIRKRTPARAAWPGQAPASPPPPQQQQPKETPRVEEVDEAEAEAEEKRVILVQVGDQEDDGIVAAAKNSTTDDVTKPEPEPPEDHNAGRCSRTDGKRWRCKSTAVPGYLFCDRHIAWSTRKRKPRAKNSSKKIKNQGSVLELEEPTEEDEEEGEDAKDEAARTPQLGRGGSGAGDDGFYYYGGFQPGSRKRARDGAPGPAA
ncbi:hypothetical protein ACP70R_019190 [Stipagrostis hirtigluma subsp. patula]